MYMSKEKLVKVGKGALIAMGGALVAYIPEAVGMIDWGSYQVLAVAIGGVLVNFLRLLIQKEA
jgi:hypothetical protein